MTNQTVTTITCLTYRDCNRAITFLKDAFGYTEKAVYRSDAETVDHAELLLGNGMVMLGTAGRNPASAAWYVLPDQTGGKVTSSVYLIVNDCSSVYDAARATGAVVLQPLETKDYGGSGFTVQDFEGHIWSVGDYDPWAAQA